MIRGRLLAGVVGAAMLLAVAVAPTLAAATLSVSPPSGVPGQVLHAIGSGFSADQQIKLQWDAGFLPETGTSDSFGAFDIPFAIPATASVGGHVLRACIRSVCSQAVPFTVSVVAGTPPPIETPSPAASAPSSSEPSAPASTPTDGSSPSPAAPSDAASPAPDASPSAVVAPTVAPTVLPAEPTAPGTVKVQFPWERIAIAAAFGLGVLLIVVAAANEKWLKGSSGKVFDRRTDQSLAAGTDAPGKTPKLYEAAAKGTHAQPTPPSDLIQHEATHADASDVEASEFNITKVSDAAGPGDSDVKLKGKKIGEN